MVISNVNEIRKLWILKISFDPLYIFKISKTVKKQIKII